jgi:hypothetical protein
MRSARVLAVIVLAVPAAALACNAITGVGDLGAGDLPCDGCTDAAIDAVTDRAVNEATVTDASVDAVDAPPDTFTRPSYCTGNVFYARFDGTLTTSQGVAPDQPPATAFVPGRFGQAAAVVGKNALYYPQGDGGFVYSKSIEGTVAMWVRVPWNWPSNVDRVVWKTMPDRVNASSNSGPHMRADVSEGFFGSSNSLSDGGNINAGAPVAQLAPYWKASAFNHLAETWSQSAPTITFTLNGAMENAAVTRRETSTPWTPEFPNVGFLRLSSDAFELDGTYDDFALWNRALSLAELRALYLSEKALGDTCGL